MKTPSVPFSRRVTRLSIACACALLMGTVAAKADFETYYFVVPDFVPDLDSSGNPTSNLNDASFKVIVNTDLDRAEIHARSKINNGTRRPQRYEDTYVGEVFPVEDEYLLLINSDIITVSSKGSVSGIARTDVIVDAPL